jgi:aminopeptidase C
MKKIFTMALAAFAMSGAVCAEEKKDTLAFEVIKENKITSIKDQNQSGTCWAYSSYAFLEAEVLRLGKGEVDLCESYLVFNTYMDRAIRLSVLTAMLLSLKVVLSTMPSMA